MPEGILFPQDNKGERSTTAAQKNIWAATFEAIGDKTTAEQIRKERNWRYAYAKYVNKHVRASLESKENALNSAKAGLQALHDSFDFVRDGKTYKLSEAMKTFAGSFEIGEIAGNKPKPNNIKIEVPYKGRSLSGDALLLQLKKWVQYGTIEPSAAEAIASVVKNQKWADLSDSYFVLLGAGSAMGPLLVLLSLGANVIALDLDREPIWKRLIELARNSCGRMYFPLKKPQSQCSTDEELFKNSGCNLITQAPEIRNWLRTLLPDKNLIVGCYVYLDGAAHVQVVLACDAIMQGLCQSRQTPIAFLCTPTDTHVISDEALQAAKQNYSTMNLNNLLVLPIRTLFGSKYLVRNVQRPVGSADGKQFAIVDGLVVAQGPNYALAKRMQHWRCIIAREENDCVVSSNVAPSTATASVVHNKQFAWAYDGMPYFKPLEIFQQETSNAVMAALLIHDIRNEKSYSHPKNRLDNPLELFKHTSFHGGVWRCGYTVGSIGEVSVLIHFVKVLKLYLIIGFLLLLAAVSYKLFA